MTELSLMYRLGGHCLCAALPDSYDSPTRLGIGALSGQREHQAYEHFIHMTDKIMLGQALSCLATENDIKSPAQAPRDASS
jgi:hypothetical protein